MPAADIRRQPIGLGWPPRLRGILVYGRDVAQDRVDDGVGLTPGTGGMTMERYRRDAASGIRAVSVWHLRPAVNACGIASARIDDREYNNPCGRLLVDTPGPKEIQWQACKRRS